MCKFHHQLTLAFVDLFAADVPYFGGGGVGYFDISLVNVSEDGSELELVVKFLSGTRYCCFEPACHFAFYDERGWKLLRHCMNRHGLQGTPLPRIRKIIGVIEPGAIAIPSPSGPAIVSEAAQYEVGPIDPVLADSSREEHQNS